MIINLSKVDFGGITGGKSKPEEVFDVQPTTADQTITPTEGSVFSGGTVRAVTKEIDANIASNNIKEGVSILGVAGSLKEEKPEESFNVQPTTAEQTITPAEGSVFSGGTVHAVTSSIDSNIQPENIKEGVSILGVDGTFSGGGGSDVFVVPPEMRFGYSKFTEFPSNWDFSEFSNVTDMEGLFYYCSDLTAVPLIDTSKATNVTRMFFNCGNLTSIPQLDFSKANLATDLFYECTELKTIPQLDFSNATNVSNLFYDCRKLVTIPPINTPKATDMSYMLQYTRSLTTVEGIDFSGLTKNLTYLFGFTSNMPNITRFIVNGKINVSISDNYSIKPLKNIDYDSVKSILAAADRTDNTNAKELAFNRTMTDQNGELAALVASCTSKGWTINGLTLQ